MAILHRKYIFFDCKTDKLFGTIAIQHVDETGISCFFYALILRERGKFFNNKVGIMEATNSMEDIWMGENQSVFRALSVPELIQMQISVLIFVD